MNDDPQMDAPDDSEIGEEEEGASHIHAWIKADEWGYNCWCGAYYSDATS